jgi:hypothetical protein
MRMWITNITFFIMNTVDNYKAKTNNGYNIRRTQEKQEKSD